MIGGTIGAAFFEARFRLRLFLLHGGKVQMKLILCLDDNNGMFFNHRRQSRDSKVVEDIVSSLDGNRLFINEYSKSLFESSVYTVLSPKDEVCADDFYFCEDKPVADIMPDVQTVIVYRWNRVYPSDLNLDIDLTKFELLSTCEFEGSSHHITKEVYKTL